MTKFIMFFIVETRPDIAFAILVASCFAKNFTHQNTKAVKTFLHYLKGLRNRGIIYRGLSELKVEEYFDSNWAENKESQKSTSGFIFMLNGDPISWYLKTQLMVAFSSIETKYIADSCRKRGHLAMIFPHQTKSPIT